MKKKDISIQYIKSLGSKKKRSEESLEQLKQLFNGDYEIEIKREIVSSIGRQTNNDEVLLFMTEQAFNNNPMELVYQMYRTCLYKGKSDSRFVELGERIRNTYHNENIEKMRSYYEYRQSRTKRVRNTDGITAPLLLVGDTENTLQQVPEGSVQLGFTSPPYYNAREYSDYCSYEEYLNKMRTVFKACNRVIEDGRFFIVNISPVITKRPGREFESIRYPIPYDFHKLLEESGFYFVDEIIWIKPEPSVPNRVGGYMQTRKALSYKPNCITESIMVYRKKCDFLLDKNVGDYCEFDRFENEEIDTSNCWYIAPKADKNHPAVFPEELCRRILKYYSFEGDVVLDPFAGSGTFGRVAKIMNRIPIMCEMNEKYAELISKEEDYEVRR